MAWYEDDAFTDAQAIPGALRGAGLPGPRGLALVQVYSEGRTQPGWGLAERPAEGARQRVPGFMEGYLARRFWPGPTLRAFNERREPFAFVMRAMRLLVVDIDQHDGAADGMKGAKALGLEPTLAETSKSGKGRHLFYSYDDSWDDALGFGAYDDAIGIVPGVDIRVVGCVYHHATQKWNDRPIAPAPQAVIDKLTERAMRKVARTATIAAIAAGEYDDEETLMMHDNLLSELNKPIAAGKRNNSLFAIGQQMKDAAYPNWEAEVERRAGEVGLDLDETAKLIGNIQRYSA